MQLLRVSRLLAAALVAIALAGCAQRLDPERAIVILVSIDGWRYDYLDRFNPPVLSRLAAEGVRSEGLIPQFPSTTFPNHYTIVTGLRLANHGILSNNMVAPDIPGEFSMSNRDVLADPRWWKGEPIWNTVERQGRVAAAMFWPGSETRIDGRQPTYWTTFDNKMPHGVRVKQLLEWLRLPDGHRPSFLTLYYSDVDSTGHRDGPDSEAVREAALNIDRSIGELIEGVRAAGLGDRVNYVVVSDHGMAALSRDRVIVLDDYIDVSAANVIDWSPLLGLSPKDGDIERLYTALKDKHPSLDVYRNRDLPAKYGFAGHPRVPPIIGIADEGWMITSRASVNRWKEPDRAPPAGAHGYDPGSAKSMLGLFVASGPGVRRGLRVGRFENIHLYELMCALLGVMPAANDGDPSVTRGMLH